MEVGLDQGVGWDSLSSGRRGDRTSGLCQQSGTMCMAWDIDEAEGIWVREIEGGWEGWGAWRR